MTAICPAGPPKLFSATLTQSQKASRNDTVPTGGSEHSPDGLLFDWFAAVVSFMSACSCALGCTRVDRPAGPIPVPRVDI